MPIDTADLNVSSCLIFKSYLWLDVAMKNIVMKIVMQYNYNGQALIKWTSIRYRYLSRDEDVLIQSYSGNWIEGSN